MGHPFGAGVVIAGALALAGCSSEPATSKEDAIPTTSAAVPTAGHTNQQPTSRASLTNPKCLSYGEWRSSVTSDGPSFPLPVFSSTIERRCATAFEDNRVHYITILPEGMVPKTNGVERAYERLPRSDTYGEQPVPGAIHIDMAVQLGSQADAKLMLKSNWTEPGSGVNAATGNGAATWRGMNISGALSPAEAKSAIESLRGRWAPPGDHSKGNDRFKVMKVAANWQDLPDGRSTLAEVGALRTDTPQSTYVQIEKNRSQVMAYVFQRESDNIACYSATVDARGKLTKARFVDPIFRREDGKPAVQSVDDFFPDEFAREPIRPASERVRRALATRSWGPTECREAFANPRRIGQSS